MSREETQKAATDTECQLTQEELQTLSDIDSTLYGFLKLNLPENVKKKSLIVKAVKCLEKVLIEFHSTKKYESMMENIAKGNDLDDETEEQFKLYVDIFCKLGHLNLLLEDYSKALSAYQKYLKLKEDHWKNSAFLFGIACVYFHYNSFNCAIKQFRHITYLDPGFIRSNEVHLRLAMMFKFKGDYELSFKHFNLVLIDSNPCTFSKSEIYFHIAHLFEIQGKHKTAKEAYEQLLEKSDLPLNIKAETFKNLGWMHHTVDSLGDKPKRKSLSLNYLEKSIEADPTNGQSLYFLGRCYASLGKVHDAFVSYRSSVDKAEANADTWISIGVLYQQQNQPMDALQAYICAVQLDKSHTAAWSNLGILYENLNQPQDALKCYFNACNGKGPTNPNLLARIKIFQNQISATPASTQRPKQLPCIEDAWNFPISQEIASRQNAAVQGQSVSYRIFIFFFLNIAL